MKLSFYLFLTLSLFVAFGAAQKIKAQMRTVKGHLVKEAGNPIKVTRADNGQVKLYYTDNLGQADLALTPNTLYKVEFSRGNVTGTVFYKKPSNGGGNGKQRRSLANLLALLIPSLTSTNDFQFITLWENDGSAGSCDFDSRIRAHYGASQYTCESFMKDTNNYWSFPGYCQNDADYSWTSITYDSACPDEDGYEIHDVFEYGDHTYDHYIEAVGSSASFVGTQVQVHAYRYDANTGKTAAFASVHIDDVSSYNTAHKFFHTFSVDLDSINDVQTVTKHEQITATSATP